MKCPKCGYIGFDYNQICSKCSKDISAEQQKLNLPAFRPEPPALLGVLLGEAGESGVHMDASTEMASMHEGPDISMQDSAAVETGELRLDDSQEVDLGLDLDAGGEAQELGGPEISMEEPAVDLDLDGSGMGEGSQGGGGMALSDTGSLSPLEEAEDLGGEISLDLEDLSTDHEETEARTVLESTAKEEENFGMDFGDLSMEEPVAPSKGTGLQEGGELPVSLDTIPPIGLGELEAGQKGEITLNLDDLKVNETGELEIGDAVAALARAETPLEIEGLQLDQGEESRPAEKKEEDEDFALLLEEDGDSKSAAEAEHEDVLDLDSLDLDLDLDLEESDRK